MLPVTVSVTIPTVVDIPVSGPGIPESTTRWSEETTKQFQTIFLYRETDAFPDYGRREYRFEAECRNGKCSYRWRW